MKIALCLLVCLCGLQGMTVKDYKAAIASKDKNIAFVAAMYLDGVGNGILIANAEAQRAGKPLYCSPTKLALTMDNYANIVSDQLERLKKMPDLDEKPVSVLLMVGLEETFPCPKGK